MSNLKQQLFEAIDTIVNKRLENFPADKTIQCIITDNSQRGSGVYTATYQNAAMTIYASGVSTSYSIGQTVFVTVPEGNFKNKKYIIGASNGSDNIYIDADNLGNLANDGSISTGINFIAFTGEENSITLCDNSLVLKNDDDFQPYYFRLERFLDCYDSDKYINIGFKLTTSLPKDYSNCKFGMNFYVVYQNADEEQKKFLYEISENDIEGNLSSAQGKISYRVLSLEVPEGWSPIDAYVEFYSANIGDGYFVQFEKFQLELMSKVSADSINNYLTYITSPNGYNFLPSDGINPYKEFVAVAQAPNGDDITEKCSYYWFIEDASIEEGSPWYSTLAGPYWRYLNFKNKDGNYIENPADDKLYVLGYSPDLEMQALYTDNVFVSTNKGEKISYFKEENRNKILIYSNLVPAQIRIKCIGVTQEEKIEQDEDGNDITVMGENIQTEGILTLYDTSENLTLSLESSIGDSFHKDDWEYFDIIATLLDSGKEIQDGDYEPYEFYWTSSFADEIINANRRVLSFNKNVNFKEIYPESANQTFTCTVKKGELVVASKSISISEDRNNLNYLTIVASKPYHLYTSLGSRIESTFAPLTIDWFFDGEEITPTSAVWTVPTPSSGKTMLTFPTHSLIQGNGHSTISSMYLAYSVLGDYDCNKTDNKISLYVEGVDKDGNKINKTTELDLFFGILGNQSIQIGSDIYYLHISNIDDVYYYTWNEEKNIWLSDKEDIVPMISLYKNGVKIKQSDYTRRVTTGGSSFKSLLSSGAMSGDILYIKLAAAAENLESFGKTQNIIKVSITYGDIKFDTQLGITICARPEACLTIPDVTMQKTLQLSTTGESYYFEDTEISYEWRNCYVENDVIPIGDYNVVFGAPFKYYSTFDYENNVEVINYKKIIPTGEYYDDISQYYIGIEQHCQNADKPMCIFRQIIPEFNTFSLDWINEWDSDKVEIGDKYIVSPNISAGQKNEDGTFTGVVMGKNAVKLLGGQNNDYVFSAYKNGKSTFTIDSMGNASMSGAITADSGYIGGTSGFVIKTGYIYNGNHNSLASTANGVYLGNDGISIGSTFKVDNTGNATISGKIIAGDNSKIGNLSLSGNKLTYGNFGIDVSTNTSTNIALWLGHTTPSSAAFRVTQAGAVSASNLTISGGSISIGSAFKVTTSGALTASSVDLTGKITASSGTIGGMKIESGQIIADSSDSLCRLTIRPVQSDKTFGVIYIGTKTSSSGSWSYPFRVNGDGSVNISKGSVTGSISATSFTAKDSFGVIQMVEGGVELNNTNSSVGTSFSIKGAHGSMTLFPSELTMYNGTNYNGTNGTILFTGADGFYIDKGLEVDGTLTPNLIYRESVSVTRNTTNTDDMSATCYYIPSLRMVFFRGRFTRKVATTAANEYIMGKVDTKYKPSITNALTLYMSATAAAPAYVFINSAGEITLRTTNTVSNPTYFYISGFWFL